MSESIMIGGTEIQLIRDDITALEIEGFVFYARPDLKLGSGFGTAISVRGGPSIQEELNELGEQAVTRVVSTKAGELKAGRIFHAVGPAFQEPDLEKKLHQTVVNVLREADRLGVKQIALPAMGAGFYGIPLTACADIMLNAMQAYLTSESSSLEKIVICVLDNREFKPFRERLGQPAMV